MRPGAWRSRLAAVARHFALPIRYPAVMPERRPPRLTARSEDFVREACRKESRPPVPLIVWITHTMRKGTKGRSFLRHAQSVFLNRQAAFSASLAAFLCCFPLT